MKFALTDGTSRFIFFTQSLQDWTKTYLFFMLCTFSLLSLYYTNLVIAGT